ncbi:hypothetical protein PMI30_00729 [Pseudomonas sp. GM50]|jgi:hypothetical protein|nr:hypothetical protein PMI30_00729 [Pseudomonas sp. GM50]
MQAWMDASQPMQLRYGRRGSMRKRSSLAKRGLLHNSPPHIQCNKPESYFAVITDSLVIPARSIEAIARATSP